MENTVGILEESSTANSSAAAATDCFSLNKNIGTAADIIYGIFAVISLVACCLVLLLIVLFKRWNFFNQRLVLYLMVATIIGYLTYVTSRITAICHFAGFTYQIGGWITLNAYICITATLLLKVFFVINLEKFDVPILLIIFISPFFFNWIPFVNNTYGKAGPLCWIKSIEEVNGTCEHYFPGQILQLVLWYIPLYTILGLMIIIYAAVFLKFCFHRNAWLKIYQDVDSERRQALKSIVSLVVYPVIYVLANIIPFVNRMYELFHTNTQSSVLWLLNGVFYPQQGLGIAIVFLLGIRSKLSVAHFKAAMSEWHHKTEIKEYQVRDDDLEPSISETFKRPFINYS